MPKIIFEDPEGRTIEVEAEAGQTLLEIAEDHGVKIGSACGGVCACSSCHVWIEDGGDSLPEPSEAEEDRLDMAFDVRPNSRLGCQVHVRDRDLRVRITPESLETWYNEHPEARAERGG